MKPGALVIALVMAGCGGSPAQVATPRAHEEPAPAATPSASASAAVPAPPASGPKPRYVARRFTQLRDGRRIMIDAGRRVVLTGDATKVVDAAPVDDLVQVLHLTEPFGGGYLFLGSHTVRFAQAVDGPLTDVATVQPGSEMKVGVAWSQALVWSERDKPVMHDLATGRVVPPPVPGLVEILAHPSGFVVGRTAAGALYVSNEKKPFKRVNARPAHGLLFDGEAVLAEMEIGYVAVGPSGETGPSEACGGCTITWGAHAFLDPYLRSAQIHETPEEIAAFATRFDDATPIRVSGRDVEIFDGTTGERVRVWKNAFIDAAPCNLVRDGKPSVVACGGGNLTVVYRLDALDTPPIEEVRTSSLPFAQEVYVSRGAVGFPLAFPGGCDGKSGFHGFCARKAGVWVDVASPPDPEGRLDRIRVVSKLATSKDGDPLMFAYVGQETDDVTIVDTAHARIRKVHLEHFASDWTFKQIEVEGDVIRVLGEDEIDIGPDDLARTKKREVSNAVRGLHGLRAKPDGGGFVETNDGGRTWHAVDPPPDGLREDDVRCGRGGCQLGPWIRIGWSR